MTRHRRDPADIDRTRPTADQLADMRQTIAEHRAFLAEMGLGQTFASWVLGARQLLAARDRRRNSGSPPGTLWRFVWRPTVIDPPGPWARWPERIEHHRPDETKEPR